MSRLLFLLPLLWPVVASGATAQPNSTAVLSKDRSSLLIVLSFDPPSDRKPTITLPDGRVINLHATVASSGVYDTATLKPRWLIDWFAYSWELRWSDDFRFVVRMNEQGFRSDWALQFYDEGRLVRQYACADVLTSMTEQDYLPYSTSNWHVQWYEDFDLDASGEKLLFSTARRQAYFWERQIDLGLQEFYEFDLATGTILDRRIVDPYRFWRYALGLVFLITVMAVAYGLFRVYLRGRRRRQSTHPALL